MSIDAKRVQAVFLAAVDVADGAQREAVLDRECAGDTELRKRVEALLKAHAAPASILDRPAATPVEAAPLGGDTLALVAGVQEERHDALPQDPPNPDATLAEARGKEEDAALSAFLQPSKKSGSLGRLGHYEVLEVVGHGGFGTVVKAFDETLHRVVAIKVMSPQLAATSPARKRFVREARAAAAMRHDNVVGIYAVEEQPIPYLVMEYIAGETMQAKLDRNGPLEVTDVLRLGHQIACGLAAAHAKGLIHRDIKPANILLEAGIEEKVKITDFGLARAADDASVTQSGVIAGTPMYMAPEQARGEAIDQRADLFSLGSVLYVMCCGRAPFRAAAALAVLKRVVEDTPRPIHEIIPEVPEWLCAIVAKLHAKDPAERFQSAAEVVDLLGQHLAHAARPHVAPLPPPVKLKRPATPRKRAWQVAAVAAGLLLAVGGAVGAYFWVHSGDANIPPIIPSIIPPIQPSLEALLQMPSPFDGRKREDIPRGLLALAGSGEPDQAPPELIAVLGETRKFPLDMTGARGFPGRSDDGKLLAVPSGDNIVLFDARTGAALRVFKGHTSRVFTAGLSHDGKRLASGAGDGQAKLWDVGTGQCVATCTGHTGVVFSVAFSADNKRLLTGSGDRTGRMWEVETGKELFRLEGHKDALLDAVFSPDGIHLATAGFDGAVGIWEADTGKEITLLKEHSQNVQRVAFSPNGKLLASGSERELILWEVGAWQRIKTLATAAGWLAFDPDGKTVLAANHNTGGAVQKLTRWDIATGTEVASFPLQSQGSYAQYVLGADGKTFFATRDTPDVPYLRAYDTANGKELFTDKQPLPAVSALAVSPDGKLLASGADRIVRIGDLAAWKAGEANPPLRILSGHTDAIHSLAFSPDGKLLASGSADSTIILWDVAGGKEQRTLTGHSLTGSRIAFSADGQTVAAGGQDGFVRYWDVQTGVEKTPQRPHTGTVRVAAYSPDGTWLASGGHDNLVQLVEIATGRRDVLRAKTVVTNLAFSRDGQTLFAVTDAPNAALRSWNVATKKETLFGETESFHALGLAIHPAGELAATSNRSGVVRFWHLPSGAALTVAVGDKPGATFVDNIAFTPEGRYLVAGNPNGTISIYRTPAPPVAYAPGSPIKLPDPIELAKRPTPADQLHRKDIPVDLFINAGRGKVDAPPELVAICLYSDRQIGHVAISSDGKFLASAGGTKNTVQLWDLANGKLLHTLSAHQGEVYSPAFGPSIDKGEPGALLLATVQSDRTVKLWDIDTGKEIRTMTGHTATRPECLAFSSDGRWLACGDTAGTILLWDAATGKRLRILPGAVADYGQMAFSPDGRFLASPGADGLIRLWDLTSGWQLAAWAGHTAPARAVAFLPDGRTLASSGQSDRAIRLWDLATLRPKQSLEGTRSTAVTLAWRADSRLLASDDISEGTVRLWDVTTEPPRHKAIHLFPATAGYVNPTQFLHGVAFTPEGRYLATANPDGTIYILRLADPGVVFAPTADGGRSPPQPAKGP